MFDDVTADRSSMRKPDVYRTPLSVYSEPD